MQSLFNQVFSTERLELCALANADAGFIQILTNTPGWLAFIGDRNIKNEAAAIAYLQKTEKNPTAKYWKVVERNTGQSIGVITLVKRDYLDEYDIGYAFLPNSGGQGFAYEATAEILKQALVKSTKGVIYAVTNKENTKSIKLLIKLGFSYVKTMSPGGDAVELYEVRYEMIILTN